MQNNDQPVTVQKRNPNPILYQIPTEPDTENGMQVKIDLDIQSDATGVSVAPVIYYAGLTLELGSHRAYTHQELTDGQLTTWQYDRYTPVELAELKIEKILTEMTLPKTAWLSRGLNSLELQYLKLKFTPEQAKLQAWNSMTKDTRITDDYIVIGETDDTIWENHEPAGKFVLAGLTYAYTPED